MLDAQCYLTLVWMLPSLSTDVLTDKAARWLFQMGWPMDLIRCRVLWVLDEIAGRWVKDSDEPLRLIADLIVCQ